MGERFYVRAHEHGATVNKADGEPFSFCISIMNRKHYNAVRVAGKIAKMLNAGKLR